MWKCPVCYQMYGVAASEPPTTSDGMCPICLSYVARERPYVDLGDGVHLSTDGEVLTLDIGALENIAGFPGPCNEDDWRAIGLAMLEHCHAAALEDPGPWGRTAVIAEMWTEGEDDQWFTAYEKGIASVQTAETEEAREAAGSDVADRHYGLYPTRKSAAAADPNGSVDPT
jgi:hypothetical protein